MHLNLHRVKYIFVTLVNINKLSLLNRVCKQLKLIRSLCKSFSTF